METRRAQWLLNVFPLHNWLKDDSRILDLACGMGYITNNLKSNLTAEIWGVDIVDYRTKAIKKNTKFNFILGDAYNLGFANEYFDSVLILVSLHHMFEPGKVIKEALRVLKPNGKLIILEDLIKSKFSIQTIMTLFIDNVINLSFTKNPNSNKTKTQWIDLFTHDFDLKLQNEYSVKWGSLFKPLELGVFVLQKGSS
jgi:ubiquinone/menaquinone biosynthesis C-methylase UbiE